MTLTARTRGALLLLVTLGASAQCVRAQDVLHLSDPAGDASPRRTDSGNNGPLNPASVLPDILSLRLYAWLPSNPLADPYSGSIVEHEHAHIFRLDLVLNGLVNPPGPLGLGGSPFDPFQFGPSPLYAFIDLNIDRSRDSGGETRAAATNRYLANVARFGLVPDDSIADRIAASGLGFDYEGDCFSTPEFHRTGADFSLALCGCSSLSIISFTGNGNSTFDPGETWVVRARLFQRAGAYRCASIVYAGSAFGLYDPFVNLRFSHDTATNLTTVSLVYALDMQGAAILTGQPQQAPDKNVANHTSILEGLQDVIDGAEGRNVGQLSGCCLQAAQRWDDRDAADYLDPTDWRVTALVGTTYASEQDSLFVWTDTGFDERLGDFNLDGCLNDLDAAAFSNALAALDGSPFDADAAPDGVVHIANHGPNFSLYDLNNDGLISQADLAVLFPPPPCKPDWNNDGVLNSQDFFEFIVSFFTGEADFNEDSLTNSQDFFDFLTAFFTGC